MTERERMALRLVEYRKRIQMSQLDFSKKIGKAQSVVSAWEKGQSSPDAELLPKIAKEIYLHKLQELKEKENKQLNTIRFIG